MRKNMTVNISSDARQRIMEIKEDLIKRGYAAQKVSPGKLISAMTMLANVDDIINFLDSQATACVSPRSKSNAPRGNGAVAKSGNKK